MTPDPLFFPRQRYALMLPQFPQLDQHLQSLVSEPLQLYSTQDTHRVSFTVEVPTELEARLTVGFLKDWGLLWGVGITAVTGHDGRSVDVVVTR